MSSRMKMRSERLNWIIMRINGVNETILNENIFFSRKTEQGRRRGWIQRLDVHELHFQKVPLLI